MRLKDEIFRRVIVPWASSGFPKIVVASSGRAGSTMLYDALADSLIRYRFRFMKMGPVAKRLKRYLAGHVYDLGVLRDAPYVVCKTHDIENNAPEGDVKYIFIYGDPLESAMSVEQMVKKSGGGWFQEHQKHLRATGAYEDLYVDDVLNYRGQLQGWLGTPRQDVMCIDYDDLWARIDDLSRFVGFPVSLPERRSRESKPVPSHIDQELFEKLRALRDDLKERYESRIG